MKLNRFSLFAALVLILTTTQAATDGQLGSSSEGTITISLAIEPTIYVPEINNINLTITDRSVDTAFSENFCVSGNSDGRYIVTVQGSTEVGNEFALTNTSNELLLYTVSYRAEPGQAEADLLTPGSSSPSYSLKTRSDGCADSPSFTVTFPSESLQGISSGSYTGSLTLMVSPV